MHRDNQGRDRNWDWAYYEYRYTPYSPERHEDYREQAYYDNSMYYGRNTNYNRNEWDRDYDPFYGVSPYYGPENYGSRSSRDTGSRGRYSGVGPRGYQRSDGRISEDINDRLTWHGWLDATDVQVEVKDGVATLTGTVDSRRDKRLAEDITDSVSGVKDVDNQLHVRQSQSYRQGTSPVEMHPDDEK